MPILVLLAASGAVLGAEQPVPRVILALYDGAHTAQYLTPIHHLTEMPLNHLGLVVRYHDIRNPLPKPEEMRDVRGVLTWFATVRMADPEAYLNWAESVLDSGKRFVQFGNSPFAEDMQGKSVPIERMNRFFEKLGIRNEGAWTHFTFTTSFAMKDSRMVEFERPLGGVMPPYDRFTVVDAKAHTYLVARRDEDPATDSALVVVTQKGGFVAPGYTNYQGPKQQQLQWRIDPFAFFREAFATDDLPKPDATTLSGRRIFYSHIDGDGWNNVPEMPEYRKREALATDVIHEQVVRGYSDLPVTVAPIAGDLDPAWGGTKKARRAAAAILAEPNVEAGSHTYSHPFFWDFYLDYTPQKEAPYAANYGSLIEMAKRLYGPHLGFQGEAGGEDANEPDIKRYASPRAHLELPFDVQREIKGSAAYINTLLPPGKKVKLLQWSGDTNPFEAALAAAREAGLANINGDDTRFDREYPSYGWVSPIGRQVGAEWQVYASSSNENTYTALWTDRFFGFRFLQGTWRNTGSPLRLKPAGLYYHMYSGEKQASLSALLSNLEAARHMELAPITASHFATIGDGFFHVRLIALGPSQWRVEDRGSLQTLRFDRATFRGIDWQHSKGVLGQRHALGSLYVALDPAEPAPVVALTDVAEADREPDAFRPYLVQSRWPVRNLRLEESDGLRFDAQGFGPGDMVWKLPAKGTYRITGAGATIDAATDSDNLLRFALPAKGIGGTAVSLRRIAPP